jgi:hypothetical protein
MREIVAKHESMKAFKSKDKCERIFSRLTPNYEGFQIVLMPPTWRDEAPVLFTFVLFKKNLNRTELRNFFQKAVQLELPNPRPFSAPFLELASLFHPLLFRSFVSGVGRLYTSKDLSGFLSNLHGTLLTRKAESTLGIATNRYYLQSLLFLSGCTLSAAIIQNRYSEGTILSKLNRLWQAAQYAKRFGYRKLNALDLESFVVECSDNSSTPDYMRLLAIKKMYGNALSSITHGLVVERRFIKQDDLSFEDRDKFGFLKDLHELLGNNLQAVFAYGSSITSRSFSDYDLIVCVQNSAEAFSTLGGKCPNYRGKEINISIYDVEDFMDFQSASGDNLDNNARCLLGEIEVPIKPLNDLMIRNFSFAFIRLRQLLGMAGYLAQEGIHYGLDGKRSLYQYFLKIPMHIMKGVRSVLKEPIAKEYLNAWSANKLGYDYKEQIALCENGKTWEAVANAYFATQAAISHLNNCYKVFKTVPVDASLLWSQLESSI